MASIAVLPIEPLYSICFCKNSDLIFVCKRNPPNRFLRKPASWLVAVCERSENRGCGGGGTKSRRAPVLSARKRSILLDYVPLGNLLTVGYRFPLGPPFWWPERP